MMDKNSTKKDRVDDFLTVLAFPPQWTPQNPHFAMTQLAGHLRANNCRVSLRDLNVEFYDHLLTPEFITFTRDRAMMNYNFLITQIRLKTLIGDESLDTEIMAMRLLEIEKFFKENSAIIEKLPDLILDAKETLRDQRRFYNPMLLVDAFYAIDKALELVSLPYHPAKLSFNNYQHPHMLMATASIIQHTGDREQNMFYNFMEEKAREILSESPGLVGVSINSFTQVLPGLTLARFLKKMAPEGTTINVGGNFLGRVKDVLLKRPEFFEHFCHCVSMGEGERQSLEMIKALSSGKSLSTVPDLLYYTHGDDNNPPEVKFTFSREPEKLDDIGYQDLEGLPLNLYFTPDLVLCLHSSKGCYWGKCTFCDTDFGVRMDVRSLDHLVGEMKYLRDKYGVRNFEFIDESIKPDYMEAMARRFIDEKLDVHWFSNGRLESGFTRELMELLYRAGLRMVLWGFESGNDRILNLINKGIDIKGRFDILRHSSQAGIWNFAYIFFGFPTETREEAMETVTAIVDNKDIIDSYGRSVFTLGKHSLLCLEADKYGIFDIVQDVEELSTNLSYKTSRGMNDEEIDDMMRQCTKICAGAYNYNLWYYLRYRENIHLYLVKYGRDYVKKYNVQQELSSRLQTW